MNAVDFLKKAQELMEERAKQYDSPNGERSMGKTVSAFNSITGKYLTEAEGWLLLQILKDVRQWQKPSYHADSAEDCVAYVALKSEALLKDSMDKPLTNKQKVDLLNTIMKPKASEQVFPDPPTRDITDLEKKFIRDLAEGNIKPGQIKAGGAWMLDREAAARAAIAEVQEPKTWLDCDD